MTESTMKIREKYLAFGTPDFTDAEIEAVTRVMKTGWVGMGPETKAFEAELADYVGAGHVVAVNSCTSALFLALLAEGVAPGDEVIVPSLTWCATANAALYIDAKPVFCDVSPTTMCATPEAIAEKITDKTKAVVVVHFGGYAIDVTALRNALPEHIAIIEDAAHALGARYPDGAMVGSSGNSVCFSFYANKNLAIADGGAIALADEEKAERLRKLSLNGLGAAANSRHISASGFMPVIVETLGYKMNFTDLQAAIGRVQLHRFESMGEMRLSTAIAYRKGLSAFLAPLQFQEKAFSPDHARHLLVGIFDPEITGIERNTLLQQLRGRNIGASLHYTPLHLMPFYQQFDTARLPVTEALADTIMTLPISAKMKPEDIDYVLWHLRDILS